MLAFSCEPVGDCLVQMGIGDIVAVLGFLLAIGVQTWAITRYMIGRMDSHRDAMGAEIRALHERMAGEIKAIHERINTVKDEYVKRVDIDRDLMHIQNTVTDMKNDVNVQMSGMNNRLDMLLSTLTPPRS